jgi:predicted metal-binding membrane protein
MSETTVRAVVRRDRAIVVAALTLITVLAWAYTLWVAPQMSMMEGPVPASAGDGSAGTNMPGMTMPGAISDMHGMKMVSASTGAEPAFRSWNIADFGFVFIMWAVMMVGMMTPSVAPMVLLYATVGRKAAANGRPLAPTGWFLAGYLSAWVAFSLAATTAQWVLTQLALLTPMMESASGIFGGCLLIAAGLYQWSPIKDTCLKQCQMPLGFLMSHGGFRSEPFGALRLGAEHGLYCIGCCWALMALLFVGGVMNVLWIAGLAVLALMEKVVPTGRLIPRLAGAGLVAAGLFLLFRASS